MAKQIIDKIKRSFVYHNINPKSSDARVWLNTKIKELSITPDSIMKDRIRLKQNSFIGKMYFFFYDPKTKEKMPYYDTFPLVIPIEQYHDGFLGLNLHYIHPKYRIILLDKLSEVVNNSKYDETTKLRISYDYLKNASKFFESIPCLKRYLFTHIQSRFLEINSNEWDIAIILPLERFEKQSNSKIWSDSKGKF